ncbi:hypothetical protein PNK_0260 [Candidatus Protochlamydia naegleriophila]|uniref:Secreted protein n=1 Tax=Candidatus Protochlamydia naegleriophila TaxID=389348 RepID=A0A0U5J744_9BACT|nr:hypothetical protein [Candidatus Protochlamydia naegleriophila]CUI15897.1 hypothetical protein PNK_0260 [Candidatus Protochlamydia naegleriophila]
MRAISVIKQFIFPLFLTLAAASFAYPVQEEYENTYPSEAENDDGYQEEQTPQRRVLFKHRRAISLPNSSYNTDTDSFEYRPPYPERRD